MSSYLQRLFDRAAGPGPGAPAALSPAFSSRSPIAEADQRLNVPELATSLLARPSVPFDAPGSVEDDGFERLDDGPTAPAPRTAAGPPRGGRSGPADRDLAFAVTAADRERTGNSGPARGAATARRIAAAVPPARAADRVPPADVPAPAVARGPVPFPPAEPGRRRPSGPLPGRPRHRQRGRLRCSRRARPRPVPPIAPPPVPVGEAEPAALREPARAPAEPARPPRPADAREPIAVRLEPAPLPEPEPLPPPAAPPRVDPAPPPRRVIRTETVTPAEPERPAAPPSRPMTATAGSVSRIGRLTPRRRAHLVFGLRRR